MKRITMFMTVLAVSAFLGFTTPVLAQQTGTTTTTEIDRETDADDDGDDEWGLLGLLGLVGLLGLKRRDRVEDTHRTTVNR
jgi:MYXO-CTERM domain-containing protein